VTHEAVKASSLGNRFRGLDPRRIRLAVFAFVLLLVAPSAEPQGVIANVCNTGLGWCLLPPGTVIQITRPCRCYTTAGQPVDGRSHSFDFSQVRRINPSPYLNPHAPAPQHPGTTP
jgi:hypothetical protein